MIDILGVEIAKILLAKCKNFLLFSCYLATKF
jgi:hypothetical protein